ncbi:MAG: ABC transporter permease [Acidobacteriaceae bacterium]
MNSSTRVSPQTEPAAAPSTAKLYLQAFWGLLLRDFRVLRREAGPFAIRVAMNPLLFLFVFTYIFPRIGQGFGSMSASGSMNFGTVLLPGLMAVAIMFTGIAAVALPLSSEFGITREIDDRVMCPLPVAGVAIEKICFSALQSIVSALIVFPLAYFIPAQPVHVHVGSYWLLAAVIVLASLVSGALGLTIGTTVEPRQIGLIFSVVVVPITFLGCVYYPWALLYHVRWLQFAVLLNPIVYMSEGLRASLTPGLPHMPVWLILGALLLSLLLLGWAGVRGFLRRVIG